MSQSGSNLNAGALFGNAVQVIRGPIVDFLATGDNAIFTFPDDFVLCAVVYVNVALEGVLANDASANLGWTAPNYTDVTTGLIAFPTSLGNERGFFLPSQIDDFPIIPGGSTLTFRLTAAESTATVYTNRIDVFGYYYTGGTSGSGGSISLTITGDSGPAGQPAAGNWDIIGGTGVSTVSSAGQLIINAPATGVTWTDVVGTSQALNPNEGYTANNAGLVTLTLPAVAAYGTTIDVVGKGAGGWLIAQLAGQTIHFNSTSTTVGVGGSLASTVQYNTVKLLCTVADLAWTVIASEGNLTPV